ncbi:MAG: DUF2807 domain-containing protein [Saprospiraceae bacterium]|nr:DUF2807 domain-containing protein [Saprospiraceae bacterium]
MKTGIAFLSLVAFTSLFVTGCFRDHFCIKGTGDLISQTIDVDPFTGIDLQIAAEVNLIQGPAQKVTAIGNENILDDLETKVVNGVWLIQLDDDKCYNYDNLVLTITVPDLDQVLLSGSGNIDMDNFSDQTDLTARILGSGNINLQEVTGTTKLTVGIHGSGNIIGHGAFPDLETLSIEITGSGNYRGYPIQTNEATVSITGSGNAYVYAWDHLSIFIAGSGNVFYKGNPSVSTTITGSGEVIDAN